MQLVILTAAFLGARVSTAQTTTPTGGQAEGQSNEQTKDVEEVVVTGKFVSETGQSALKSDVPLRDVPITVSSYTGEFMKAIETTRISDLYNYMTGVQRAGTTAYDVSIRGFASGGADRNTIMVDGLPGEAVRFGSPPTINAERVEVVKGPASILYGQIQPGGFINIITKKPEAERSTLIKLRGDDFYGGDANSSDSFGKTLSFDTTGAMDQDNKVLYRFIAEYGDTPGFRQYGKEKNTYYMPSVTVNFSDDTTATAFLEYRKDVAAWDDGLVAGNDANGFPDYHLINPDITTYYHEPGNTGTEEGYTYGLSATHYFTSNLQWRTNFRGVNHEDSRVDIDEQAIRTCSPNSVAGMLDPTAQCLRRRQRDQLNKRSYDFLDTNLVLDVDNGENVAHKFIVGFNAGRETADFKRNDFGSSNDTYDISILDPVHGQFTPNDPKPGSWDLTTYDSKAVYAQDQVSFGEQWKLLVAGRYEEFNIVAESKRPIDDPNYSDPQYTDGYTFKPMVGLLYQPNDRWSYYLSYATSFNPPAPGRLDVNGNIFTDPEEGVQYEAGVKSDLFQHRATVTASVFQITKKNSLQQIGTSGAFQLTGEEESKGLELEVDLSLTDRWQLLGGYSYVDATVKTDVDPLIIGQNLRNAPKNTASMWNRYQFSNAFSVGVGINYVADRFGTVPDDEGDAARLFLPSYTVVDAALYYQNERSGWGATLKFSNLLDEKYYESAFTPIRITPGAPANITLTVDKTFGQR